MINVNTVVLQTVEAVPQHVAGLWIEPSCRLVEQEQVWLVDQRASDRQTSHHPAAQGVDDAVGPLAQLDELQQCFRPATALGTWDVEVATVQNEVLHDGELFVEGVELRHHAEPTADRSAIGCGVHAEDVQRPRGGRRYASDHAHRRRLAGAIRAEESERLALVDVEVDRVDRDEFAVLLGEAPRRDQCFAHPGDTSQRPR